jgi:hypothetical protein
MFHQLSSAAVALLLSLVRHWRSKEFPNLSVSRPFVCFSPCAVAVRFVRPRLVRRFFGYNAQTASKPRSSPGRRVMECALRRSAQWGSPVSSNGKSWSADSTTDGQVHCAWTDSLPVPIRSRLPSLVSFPRWTNCAPTNSTHRCTATANSIEEHRVELVCQDIAVAAVAERAVPLASSLSTLHIQISCACPLALSASGITKAAASLPLHLTHICHSRCCCCFSE